MTTQHREEDSGEASKKGAAMKGGALLGAIVGSVLLPVSARRPALVWGHSSAVT